MDLTQVDFYALSLVLCNWSILRKAAAARNGNTIEAKWKAKAVNMERAKYQQNANCLEITEITNTENL